MRIEVLGAESLGVRGLSCVVEVENHKIVIDPGLALGYRRDGLLPYPVQVAVGEQVRQRILTALKDATDVVMSHFHGDHVPLPEANPYQLKAVRVAPLCRTSSLWAKGPEGLSSHMQHRRMSLSEALGRELPNAEGKSDGPLTFSPAVPHGEPHTHLGTVMMTRVTDETTVFVHASDIQLLDDKAVSWILNWHPDIALVGGPPLYLADFMGRRQRRTRAWKNAQKLARHVNTLVLDHHLLRCEEGLSWLDRLSAESGHRVICAADFVGRPRRLLEAHRAQLYAEMPVPDGWHKAYARGDVDVCHYRSDENGCEGVRRSFARKTRFGQQRKGESG
jgi:predicted metallo-beta-lactamase superfamily hydrolase